MKEKIVITAIFLTLLIGGLNASGISIKKTELQMSSDSAPEIYSMHVYTSCKEVNWGYAKIFYKALSKNEIGGEVDIIFDWGDGTESTMNGISDWVYANHEYSSSGTYQVKAKYDGYETWSEPFEFSVVDHCDLEIIDVYTIPDRFSKKDKIDIKATVKNVGTLSTTEDTTLYLYEGYDNLDSENPITQKQTGLIAPGEEVTLTLEDFKWYGDEVTHSFWAKVEPVDGEIDFTDLADNIDDPNLNNVGDGHFTAPKAKSLIILRLFEKFPILEIFLS